jgi:hypothetical protein
MKCAPWLLASLTVAWIAGCGGDRRSNDNSAAGTSTETGTMQGAATTTDTAMSSGDTSATSQGMSSDTAQADAGMHGDMNQSSSNTGRTGSDSAKGNQTKSGVTNTQTGKSTLGKDVTKTRPDQGQPVTSKGDTVSSGPDTTGGNQ